MKKSLFRSTIIQNLRASIVAGFVFFSISASAAPGDLDPTFVAGIGAGITPPNYPTFETGTGAVNAVALQSDGKILAGGNVSRYNNTGSLTALKRITPDGSLDTSFNSGGAGLTDTQGQPEVNSIVVLPDDSILIGGVFTHYNGTPRNGILKLYSDGSLDPNFAPSGLAGTLRYVMKITIQGDGKILIGGGFTSVNGTFRNNIARLNANGSLDTTFSANSIGLNSVMDIKQAADGKIYVGGNPLTTSDTGLRRLYENGAIDTSFIPALGANSGIHAILLLPNGNILAGGFTELEPLGYNDYLAALTPTGQIDTTFMANMGTGPNGYCGYELLEAPNGKILVASRFSRFNGQPRAAIARLFADGTPDTSFAPLPYTGTDSFLTHFYGAAYQQDGKIVAGGWFDHVSDPNLETYNLTRFEGDTVSGPGTIRWTTSSAQTAEGNTVTLTATRFGGITGAVSVDYSTSNGTASAASDFISVSGTFSWAAGTGGSKSVVITTLQDTDDEGGENFTVALSSPTGGATIAPGQGTATVTILDDDTDPVFILHPQSSTGIATLSATFSGAASHALPITYQWFKDGSTTPIGTSSVLNLANLQPSSAGSYVLRATITDPQTNLPRSVDSTPAILTVVEPPGSRDLTFTPGTGFGSQVNKILMLADGSAIVGGTFTQYSGTPSNYLAKLSPAGALVTPWPASGTGPSSEVRDISPTTGGKFLIAGTFTTVSGTSQQGIARINADGSHDATFVRTVTGAARVVRTLSDGTILAGFDSGSLGLRKFNSTGTELASFVPFGSNTAIYDIVVQADDKILVAAYRNNPSNSRIGVLYRLLPDLTPDPDFNIASTNTASNAILYDIAQDTSGRIYLAGSFNSVNGVSRGNLARLQPNGTLDQDYSPTITSAVRTLFAQDDGRLLIGGDFTTVDGVSRPRIARLLPNARLDSGFFPGTGANQAVLTLDRSPSGQILMGGFFTTFSGATVGYIARMNGDFGSMQFAASSLSVNEQAGTATVVVKRLIGSRGPASVQYQRNGGTAVAGTDFTGTTSGTLNWADGDSSDRELVFTILNNGLADGTRTLGLQLFNAIYPSEIGGISATTLSILDDESLATIVTPPQPVTVPETTPATFSVVVDSATTLSYQWFKGVDEIPGASLATYTIPSTTLANAGDYSVRITNSAGSFFSPVAALTVLKSPSALATGWAPSGPGAATLNGIVRAILPLPDGGALVGGDFSLPQRGIVRIDATGARVSAFTLALDSTAAGTGVHDILMDGEGRVYLAGRWDSIGGKTYANLVRLKPDFTIDDDFSTALGTGPEGLVRDVSPDSNGGILIGGSFTRVNGLPGTAGFASISELGFLDRTLVSLAAIDVYRIARMPGSDKIYIGTSTVGYASGTYIIRLNPNGTRDFTFNPGNLNGAVRDFALRPDGGVVIGGAFTGTNAYLTSMLPSGAIDITFLPTVAIGGNVNSVATQPNGKFAIGGAFTTFGGTTNRFARVNANGSLDKNLNLGTGFGGEVHRVAVAADGRLWIGGNFTQFKGASATYLVRLHGDDVPTNILTQPQPQDVVAGTPASFTVTTTGTASPSFQWFKNGTPLTNGANISGATTATLTVSNAQLADEAFYSVQVTASGSTVTSQSVSLRIVAAYEFDTLTTGGEFPVGRRFVFAASGAGAAPLSYQWKKGPSNVPGATSPVFAIANPTTADSGSYTLEVTNSFGTVISDAVNVTFVDPAPAAIRHTPLTTAGGNGSMIYPIPDGRFFLGFGASSLRLYNTAGVQTTIPAFNNRVNQVLRLSNGGYLVAGQFTTPGKWLVRLNPDFTHDTAFQAKLGTFNGSGGSVARVVELPDGRIAVAGNFSDLNGATGTRSLVILRPDGTRDASMVSLIGTTSSIGCMEYDAADTTLILGGFSFNYAGVTRSLHRVRLNGTRDASLDVLADASVSTIALQPDRKILLGGAFSTVQGVARIALARVGPTGVLDTTFTPQSGITSGNSYGPVNSIALEPDGDIVIVGNFPIFSGIGHNDILRLRPNGDIDTRFNPGFGFDGNGSRAESAAIAADGSIYITGSMQSYNGTTINDVVVLQGDRIPLAFAARPARVEALAGASFTLSATGVGTSTVSYQWYKGTTPLSDGGDITGSATATLTIANAEASDAGTYRVEITNLSGTLEASAPVAVFDAPVIVDQPLGGTFFVGNSAQLYSRAVGSPTLTYQWFKGTTPLTNGPNISGSNGPVLTLTNLQKADSGNYSVTVTNSIDSATSTIAAISVLLEPGGYFSGFPITAGSSAYLRTVLPTAAGGAFIGGGFSSAGLTGSNTAINNLARLNPDGTVDTSFNPTPTGEVTAIAAHQADGILIGGSFTTIGGQSRPYLARYTTAGAYDTTFNTNLGTGPSSNINDIVALPDGKILIGGIFQTVSGTTRYGLARLNANGTHDTTFAPPMSLFGNVNDIAVSTDGKITITGSFSMSGRQNIARLNSDGTLDTTFTATLDFQGQAVAVQPDGKTIVGGFFTATNGQATGSLVRFNPNGTTDTTFAANSSFPSTVNRIALQPNGRIVVGGSFTFSGITRGLIRLLPDGGVDTTFAVGNGWGSSGQTYDLKVTSTGTIWAAGSATTFNGQTVNYLAVFNGDEQAPGATFSGWVTEKALPTGKDGPLDDADSDGISNLLEYALGLEPMESDPDELPPPVVENGLLKYTYVRVRSDIIYTVEKSDNLQGWSSLGVDQGTPAPDGTTTASVPFAPGSRFVHLKVELVP